MRMEESFEGRAKDCSKGFGSRSKVERVGRGGSLVVEEEEVEDEVEED